MQAGTQPFIIRQSVLLSRPVWKRDHEYAHFEDTRMRTVKKWGRGCHHLQLLVAKYKFFKTEREVERKTGWMPKGRCTQILQSKMAPRGLELSESLKRFSDSTDWGMFVFSRQYDCSDLLWNLWDHIKEWPRELVLNPDPDGGACQDPAAEDEVISGLEFQASGVDGSWLEGCNLALPEDRRRSGGQGPEGNSLCRATGVSLCDPVDEWF